MLRDLVEEFGIKLQLSFEPSEKNKVDVFNRVRKTWLRVSEPLAEGMAAANYFVFSEEGDSEYQQRGGKTDSQDMRQIPIN